MFLAEGKEFKFKSRPVDPNDPFRGKYITLSFDSTSTKVADAQDWKQGDPVYVLLSENEDGFARINSVTKDKPTSDEDFVNATIDYIIPDTMTYVSVDYPFTRFYMEESLSESAAEAYAEAARDTNKVTYALVAVKDGEAVIEDVLIDGKSIREAAKVEKEKENQ